MTLSIALKLKNKLVYFLHQVSYTFIGCMQTTYENFRYRYDKRENPYNQGALRNFKEIFFSKIPPSMNFFRAPVYEEEHMPNEYIPPPYGVNASSKEKIDIEMGEKLVEDDEHPLPTILRNLDYDYIEDNLKSKEGGEGAIIDPFLVDEEPKHLLHPSLVEEEFNDEQLHQRSSSCRAMESNILDPRCLSFSCLLYTSDAADE